MSIIRSYFCLFIFFISCVTSLTAQDRLPPGRWRNHLASSSSSSLAKAGNVVYSGSSFSLLSYDKSSGTTKKLSKIEGYAQSDISKLGYNEITKTLVIAYQNGQMDLKRGEEKPFTVNDIFNASISGSKKINHLRFFGNKVWISTDFGLVVYNLERREVTEVYSNFSSNTSVIQIYSSCAFNDSIFIATSSGLFASSLKASVNKLDYKSWRPLQAKDLPSSKKIQFLETYDSSMYLATDGYLISYRKGDWLSTSFINSVPSLSFLNVTTSNNRLWFLTYGNIFYLDKKGMSLLPYGNQFSAPREIIQDEDSTIWVSEDQKGLFSNLSDPEFTLINSNGPVVNTAFKLSSYEDKIAVLVGGYDPSYTQLRRSGAYSIFDNGIWQNFSQSNGNIRQFEDVVSSAYNPLNNKVYFASYGWGVVEWDKNDKYEIFNNKTPNCPLNTCNIGDFCFEDYPNPTGSGNYCRVIDVSVDNKGTLWVLNHQDIFGPTTKGVLFSYDLKGTWSVYSWRGDDYIWGSANYTAETDVQYLRKIIVDKNNTKWMASRSNGLLVFNENTAPIPRFLQYEKYKTEEICGTKVLSLTEDLDGAIWIGTDNGICYFSDPSEVLQKRAVRASIPVFENRALLSGNQINAIEVDGGNRKWVGTNTSGAWLFSSDGTTNILHFDQSNSPLPSNNIVDIKINNKTGEVFFATDKGIFSYTGDAILATEKNTEVIAFPNPVTRDYTGNLSISGLAKNATVKITDISGQVIYQTKAQGSLASWNIKDYTGRRAQPGVYIVFSSKEDGTEALATKIAIID